MYMYVIHVLWLSSWEPPFGIPQQQDARSILFHCYILTILWFSPQRHPLISPLSWLSYQLYPQPMTWSLLSKKPERCSKPQELVRKVSPGVYLRFLPTMQRLGSGCLEAQPCNPSAISPAVLSCPKKLTDPITEVSFHTSVILLGPH